MTDEDAVSSRKYAPFGQTPSPHINPQIFAWVLFSRVNSLYWSCSDDAFSDLLV